MVIISEPRRKNEDTEEAQKRRKQRAKKRKQQMQKKIEENKVHGINNEVEIKDHINEVEEKCS